MASQEKFEELFQFKLDPTEVLRECYSLKEHPMESVAESVPSGPRLAGYSTDRGYPETVLEGSQSASQVFVHAFGILNSATTGSSKPHTKFGPSKYRHRLSIVPWTHR